jgi:D-alanyl-D-alanine carboxypeptidase/D-alanyl-D-alanine carboxypeptidase (penicillin-binding protein 5/6)
MIKRAMYYVVVFLLIFALSIVFDTDASAWDDVSAKAAIVIDTDSKAILYEKNINERLPMASTTKIMTALLALENPYVDVEFTVDSDAIRVEGSSMGLHDGDVVTLRQLAYGLLLASGNDAANAAAVAMASNIPMFADMMNERAKMLELRNTNFTNPSGLHDENHYTTAYDLAMLGIAAIANREFRSISSQTNMQTQVPRGTFWLTNHNKMLRYYKGTIGIKTGFTKASGRCLVTAAEKDGVTLVAVTLDAPDDWSDHRKMLDYAFSRVESKTYEVTLPMTSLPVDGGERDKVYITYKSELAVTLMKNSANVVNINTSLPEIVTAPVRAGDVLGNIELIIDGKVRANSAVIAIEDVLREQEKPTLWERIGELFKWQKR